ncbi:DUF364 domain-containing protein [Clostridium estertheticum]|uniref:Rossmann-like domain-containing protein n=1 Tax=Clostridium estertheticum TaxID=238834 RepID=UPI001C0D1C9A|nr:DUF364 domain-containing protein [Clostridium estertheticum]MBU3213749.1 DUF364 domain-containing protein [Clostridium estertheticum]MBW9150737.1 DUF364 domain-containing protein [Clostridium estertheticum]WAG53638.1 DUF364 domain-containing protein [Clostridium estertheticum]WLC84530.1 DUF364 domain-containing protein [Clostridium estertheticum]
MWEIYDDLIDGIPKRFIADEIICGKYNSYVRSGNGCGISGNNSKNETRMPMFAKNLVGMPLREVATCVKSWNFMEASIGGAAINAYYNNPQVARANGVEFSDNNRVEDRVFDPFIMSQNYVKGKKVVVVGHFPYLENLLEPICDLSIIEWEPEEGDYPMYASEYLIPKCDYVYLSSASIVNKTLPRLLELSKNAKQITMVGRGTTLSPKLFNYGIGDLSGFMIKDNLRAFRVVAGAENVKISTAGQKVSFKKSIEVK